MNGDFPITLADPMPVMQSPRQADIFIYLTGGDGNGSYSWVQVNEANSTLANYTTANFSLSGNLTSLPARETNFRSDVANGTRWRAKLSLGQDAYLFDAGTGPGNATGNGTAVYLGNVTSSGNTTTPGNATRLTITGTANGTIGNASGAPTSLLFYPPFSNYTQAGTFTGVQYSPFPVGQRVLLVQVSDFGNRSFALPVEPTIGNYTPSGFLSVPRSGWLTTQDQTIAGNKSFEWVSANLFFGTYNSTFATNGAFLQYWLSGINPGPTGLIGTVPSYTSGIYQGLITIFSGDSGSTTGGLLVASGPITGNTGINAVPVSALLEPEFLGRLDYGNNSMQLFFDKDGISVWPRDQSGEGLGNTHIRLFGYSSMMPFYSIRIDGNTTNGEYGNVAVGNATMKFVGGIYAGITGNTGFTGNIT